MNRFPLSRRDLLRLAAAGVSFGSASGWLKALAAGAAPDPRRKRACILLWMTGGPSQMDTFDLKPGHKNGGPFQEIATSVPGLRISEHLPRLAGRAQHLALLRSMSTKEGDHGRATFYLRTGYLPQGPVQYPPAGALLAKELGDPDADLPSFVSISPPRTVNPAAFGSGFLGPRYAPLMVGESDDPRDNGPAAALRVQDLALPVGISAQEGAARLNLLRGLEEDFVGRVPDPGPRSHQSACERAVRLMRTTAARAFDLEEEPDRLKDAYGRTLFGQGCLLARRLVERGVPFVEVALGGWDTHIRNFDALPKLCAVLDAAWSALLDDLQARGLLDDVVVAWAGEFGRTPQINGQVGRDHFPNAWTTVLAGGGIKGGQAVGKTSADGVTVEDRPVTAPDFLATLCRALGVDPMKQNLSNVGRPIRLADPAAQAVTEVLG